MFLTVPFYLALYLFVKDSDQTEIDLLQVIRVKKDAIILAIKTFLDVRRREKLAALIGNYDFGYSLKDLEEMRKDG